MVVNGRPLKRMKKRVTADLYDFLTFPTSVEFSDHLGGPFRLNIRSFLRKHARQPYPCSLFPHLLTWQIVCRVGELIDGQDSFPAMVSVDIVEEDVTRSRSVYCDQCRVIGWSGHPVCGKRYHFIIRRDCDFIDGYLKSCTRCGELLHLSDSRCKSCNHVMSEDELENWVHLQLEDTTHLLHGVVHSNGYGHLLKVNGREGGSKFLSGFDIMNFWDRLCTTLAVRKVSVMDVSKKYGFDYRLLHAVTKGHPWYGNWGYEFGAGSFAVTLDAYQKAVDSLSEVPLSLFSQGRKPRTRLQDIIAFYQSLSELELCSTRDLFCFLMSLIHKTHEQSSVFGTYKTPGTCSTVVCAWTKDDVENVEQAMIKVLRAVGGCHWVSWRALKGAMCRVASAELLNYCLKGLGGKSVGNGMFVHSRCNPDTDAIEYRIVPHDDSSNNISCVINMAASRSPTKYHLLRDLNFLYDALLNPQTMLEYRPKTTRELAVCSAAKLLDCKHFVKDYEPEKVAIVNPFAIQLKCSVELIDQPKDYTAPPSELIVLPVDATVADLKREAAEAFQEVYLLFKRFQVEGFPDFNVNDSDSVKLVIGSNGLIRVHGRCLGNDESDDLFRMERGPESWTVNCLCGARDDDGERMLACDACGIWQHTRCAGIHDFEPAPDRFNCGRCGSSSKKKGSIIKIKNGRNCKDQTGTVADSCKIDISLSVI